MFHPWSYFMQYDQHYISRTKILNLMMKKVFWDEKLGRLDRRFSQSTKYSYLKVNSNDSWFLHRSSVSRAVMPIWFEYWDVQAGILARFTMPWLLTLWCSPLLHHYNNLGPNFLSFLCHKFYFQPNVFHKTSSCNMKLIKYSLFYLRLRKTSAKKWHKYIYWLSLQLAFIGKHVVTRCIT